MKTGVLINAKLGSKRLPDKHMQDVAGQSALSQLVGRLQAGCHIDKQSADLSLVIATGDIKENKPLEAIAKNKGIQIVYADPDNIPNRHLQVAQQLHLDAIVSVDGDDLLSSPDATLEVIKALRSGAALVRSEGLPFGMNVWGYSVKTLAAALQGIPPQSLLETGWGRIFSEFKAEVIQYAIPQSDMIRASLDYPEDLEFFRKVFASCPAEAMADDAALCRWILSQSVHLISYSRHLEYWNNFMSEKNKEDALLDESYSKRLHAVIPGGAHTYSRGDDQYPQNAPKILERGEGAYVWTPTGKRFLDYGMALRAVNIGYAEPSINAAAIRQIEHGNNLTRASTVELEAAELLVSLVDSVDMVKFTKNGSTATSAAVKLARAYTGRDLIARCAQHPFFSYDDWFIGSTPLKRGIPDNIIQQTKMFNYNDLASLERLIEAHPNQFSCVIMEPAALDCPATVNHPSGCCQKAVCDRYPAGSGNFLKDVQALCRKHGIVFILDEMITGFRWHLKGSQHCFGIEPDLSTFGKAMANGFSVAAVAGKRELMQLGSTDRPGMERLFLLSTTHGAEMCGLGAFIETVRFIERENVISHLWNYGARIVNMMKDCATAAGIQDHFKMVGPVISPAFVFMDHNKDVSFQLRTLFLQETIKHNVLMPWLAFSYRHGDEEFAITKAAVEKAMAVIKLALNEGIEKYLVGPAVKPVFRQFN